MCNLETDLSIKIISTVKKLGNSDITLEVINDLEKEMKWPEKFAIICEIILGYKKSRIKNFFVLTADGCAGRPRNFEETKEYMTNVIDYVFADNDTEKDESLVYEFEHFYIDTWANYLAGII